MEFVAAEIPGALGPDEGGSGCDGRRSAGAITVRCAQFLGALQNGPGADVAAGRCGVAGAGSDAGNSPEALGHAKPGLTRRQPLRLVIWNQLGMGWLKKKSDPISQRARALNAEIAALESQIKRLDSRLQHSPPQ